MILNETMAKPYAKAIFNLALRDEQLLQWLDTLKLLSMAVRECKKTNIINDPKIETEKKIALFIDITKEKFESKNLIEILAKRKILDLLPAICLEYEKILSKHNKKLEAKVVTAFDLDKEQETLILEALKKRYKREISLQCQIDTTLIGGAIVYVSDRVIDYSVKGILRHLKYNLLSKEITC